jgi:hypothetical protein
VAVTAAHVLSGRWRDGGNAGGGLVGGCVSVDGLEPGQASARSAVVAAVDLAHDLAVLRLVEPLPGTVASLSASAEVAAGAEVVVSGHAVGEDGSVFRHLSAVGVWGGPAMRGDAIALARMSSKDLLRGMSGAPVRRTTDGAVVGVVSARYNSADGWLRDAVWVARVEDLLPLLEGVAEVVAIGMPRLGEPADLTFTVDAGTVHLFGAGVDVTAAHQGVRPGLAGAVDDVRRARARAVTVRASAAPELATGDASMRRVWERLAESFPPGPVREALAG